MKPVKQTKLYSSDGIHNGNCLAACLASLLELPLWMVPPFEDMFGRGHEYHDRIEEWLATVYKMEYVRIEGHPVDQLPEFYIASGMSARGVMHAVIYSGGALVHDPHFSDSGVAEVLRCQYLKPLPDYLRGDK
jgi:hypothetical protein